MTRKSPITSLLLSTPPNGKNGWYTINPEIQFDIQFDNEEVEFEVFYRWNNEDFKSWKIGDDPIQIPDNGIHILYFGSSALSEDIFRNPDGCEEEKIDIRRLCELVKRVQFKLDENAPQVHYEFNCLLNTSMTILNDCFVEEQSGKKVYKLKSPAIVSQEKEITLEFESENIEKILENFQYINIERIGILKNTIVIKNFDETITYTENEDYEIEYNIHFQTTRIKRLVNSDIPNNSQIKIEYEFQKNWIVLDYIDIIENSAQIESSDGSFVFISGQDYIIEYLGEINHVKIRFISTELLGALRTLNFKYQVNPLRYHSYFYDYDYDYKNTGELGAVFWFNNRPEIKDNSIILYSDEYTSGIDKLYYTFDGTIPYYGSNLDDSLSLTEYTTTDYIENIHLGTELDKKEFMGYVEENAQEIIPPKNHNNTYIMRILGTDKAGNISTPTFFTNVYPEYPIISESDIKDNIYDSPNNTLIDDNTKEILFAPCIISENKIKDPDPDNFIEWYNGKRPTVILPLFPPRPESLESNIPYPSRMFYRWDEEEEYTEYTNPFLIPRQGENILRIYVCYTDGAGAGYQTTAMTFIYHWDNEAPITEDNTPYKWLNIGTTINFLSRDIGSGQKHTYYKVFNVNTDFVQKTVNFLNIGREHADPNYITFSEFNLLDENTQKNYFYDYINYWSLQFEDLRPEYEIGNNVIITGEGQNIITYFSEDYAGNIESIKISNNMLRLDKTKPCTVPIFSEDPIFSKSTLITCNDSTTWTKGHYFFDKRISVQFVAFDQNEEGLTLSGIDKTFYRFEGQDVYKTFQEEILISDLPNGENNESYIIENPIEIILDKKEIFEDSIKIIDSKIGGKIYNINEDFLIEYDEITKKTKIIIEADSTIITDINEDPKITKIRSRIEYQYKKDEIAVFFYSVDVSGNVEDIKKALLKFNIDLLDIIPPKIFDIIPKNNTKDVSNKSVVEFFINDENTGVDLDSIEVIINERKFAVDKKNVIKFNFKNQDPNIKTLIMHIKNKNIYFTKVDRDGISEVIHKVSFYDDNFDTLEELVSFLNSLKDVPKNPFDINAEIFDKIYLLEKTSNLKEEEIIIFKNTSTSFLDAEFELFNLLDKVVMRFRYLNSNPDLEKMAMVKNGNTIEIFQKNLQDENPQIIKTIDLTLFVNIGELKIYLEENILGIYTSFYIDDFKLYDLFGNPTLKDIEIVIYDLNSVLTGYIEKPFVLSLYKDQKEFKFRKRSNGYFISVKPDFDYENNATNTVNINARDKYGNQMDTFLINFISRNIATEDLKDKYHIINSSRKIIDERIFPNLASNYNKNQYTEFYGWFKAFSYEISRLIRKGNISLANQYFSEVKNMYLYQNFGKLMDFKFPRLFSTTEYRDSLNKFNEIYHAGSIKESLQKVVNIFINDNITNEIIPLIDIYPNDPLKNFIFEIILFMNSESNEPFLKTETDIFKSTLEDKIRSIKPSHVKANIYFGFIESLTKNLCNPIYMTSQGLQGKRIWVGENSESTYNKNGYIGIIKEINYSENYFKIYHYFNFETLQDIPVLKVNIDMQTFITNIENNRINFNTLQINDFVRIQGSMIEPETNDNYIMLPWRLQSPITNNYITNFIDNGSLVPYTGQPYTQIPSEFDEHWRTKYYNENPELLQPGHTAWEFTVGKLLDHQGFELNQDCLCSVPAGSLCDSLVMYHEEVHCENFREDFLDRILSPKKYINSVNSFLNNENTIFKLDLFPFIKPGNVGDPLLIADSLDDIKVLVNDVEVEIETFDPIRGRIKLLNNVNPSTNNIKVEYYWNSYVIVYGEDYELALLPQTGNSYEPFIRNTNFATSYYYSYWFGVSETKENNYIYQEHDSLSFSNDNFYIYGSRPPYISSTPFIEIKNEEVDSFDKVLKRIRDHYKIETKFVPPLYNEPCNICEDNQLEPFALWNYNRSVLLNDSQNIDGSINGEDYKLNFSGCINTKTSKHARINEFIEGPIEIEVSYLEEKKSILMTNVDGSYLNEDPKCGNLIGNISESGGTALDCIPVCIIGKLFDFQGIMSAELDPPQPGNLIELLGGENL